MSAFYSDEFLLAAPRRHRPPHLCCRGPRDRAQGRRRYRAEGVEIHFGNIVELSGIAIPREETSVRPEHMG